MSLFELDVQDVNNSPKEPWEDDHIHDKKTCGRCRKGDGMEVLFNTKALRSIWTESGKQKEGGRSDKGFHIRLIGSPLCIVWPVSADTRVSPPPSTASASATAPIKGWVDRTLPDLPAVEPVPPAAKPEQEDGEEMQKLRKVCWSALASDQPHELTAALFAAVGGREERIPELLTRLELGLWAKGRGKYHEGWRYGLMNVAASNFKGVPQEGALECLDTLLRRFPAAWSSEQISMALSKAKELRRTGAVKLLVEWDHTAQLKERDNMTTKEAAKEGRATPKAKAKAEAPSRGAAPAAKKARTDRGGAGKGSKRGAGKATWV